MNGKQARMLRQMLASKDDKKTWQQMQAEQKGKLRRFHQTNEKTMYFSFKMAVREMGFMRSEL